MRVSFLNFWTMNWTMWGSQLTRHMQWKVTRSVARTRGGWGINQIWVFNMLQKEFLHSAIKQPAPGTERSYGIRVTRRHRLQMYRIFSYIQTSPSPRWFNFTSMTDIKPIFLFFLKKKKGARLPSIYLLLVSPSNLVTNCSLLLREKKKVNRLQTWNSHSHNSTVKFYVPGK